jgi:hypothetical protein
MHHEKEISQSTNKTKAAWNIIRSLTNKRVNSNEELVLNYKGKLINDPQTLAETFNNLLLLCSLSIKLWNNVLGYFTT